MFEQRPSPASTVLIDPDHAAHQFLRWQQSPPRTPPHGGTRSRRAATAPPLSGINRHRFLLSLADHDRRHHTGRPTRLTSSTPTPRRFLTWAIRAQHMPHLHIPVITSTERPAISQPDRDVRAHGHHPRAPDLVPSQLPFAQPSTPCYA